MKLRIGLLVTLIVVLVGCAASAPPGVGIWDVEMDTPAGAQAVVLTISENGTGSMAGAQGEQAISAIVLKGNAISFEANINAQGQSITLNFSGTVDGDALSGGFSTPFGELEVTGMRR